jgi:Ca2+/Na+ antiporter
MRKYTRREIYQITAACLFLIGAIFMLVNTFADQPWSFWVGFGFAVAAACVYLLLVWESRHEIFRNLKSTSYSDKQDNTNEHEKNVQIPASEDKTAK